MKPRRIITIRLSKRWARPELDAVHSLAIYLYSFYQFLGLADPSASLQWGLANGSKDGVPLLILLEIPQGADSDDESQLPTEEELADRLESELEDLDEDDFADDGGEEKLPNPDPLTNLTDDEEEDEDDDG